MPFEGIEAVETASNAIFNDGSVKTIGNEYYEDRPLLCRLFGNVSRMPCPFGCEPKGGFISPRNERKIWNLVYGKDMHEGGGIDG